MSDFKIAGVSLSDFTGFITKYAGELGGIASVLSTIVGELPLGSTKKDQVSEVLNGLNDASTRISNAAKGLAKAPPVVIKKSDIEAILIPLVNDAVAKAVAAAKVETK